MSEEPADQNAAPMEPGTHIEVQEALGDQALGGGVVSDPSSQPEAVKENPVAADPSNYIEKPEEAHDVVMTSKSVRDEWAASRLAGDTMESYVTEHGEDAIPSDERIGEHERVIQDTLAERGLEIGDVEMNALSTGRGRLERGENGEPINTSHRFAERRLEEAERLEKWAGVLHGKRLKPEFVKQNLIPEGEPEHEITATDLAHLETTAVHERETATSWHNELATLEAIDRQTRELRAIGKEHTPFSLIPAIDRKTRALLDRGEDQALLDVYSRLDQADETTNLHRKKFYHGLCLNQEFRHQMTAAVIEKKLREITSGLALEEVGSPPTEEQTPQSESPS